MINFAPALKPEPLPHKAFLGVSYALGLVNTILVVMQMASFEDFVAALQTYHLFGAQGTVAFAIALLSVEVFSVPFLFRLALSRLARSISALFGVMLPYIWTVLVLNDLLEETSLSNVGLLGGFVAVPGGGLALTLCLVWMIVVGVSFGAIGGRKALRLYHH